MNHIDPDNPFASPLEQARPASHAYTDQEAVRRQYLGHEASVRSMGCLFIAGAVFGCLLGVMYVVMGLVSMTVDIRDMPAGVGLIIVFISVLVIAFSIFQLWTGIQLRSLHPRARVPAIVISAIGLLWIPIGTLINGYFLYLVASAKGEYVLSDAYADVRRATPHIKYKTPLVVWILVGLLVVVLTIGCFSVILG